MSDIEDSKPPAKKQKLDKDEPVVPLRKSTRANKSTKSFKESDDDEYIEEEEQQEWQEMAAKKSKSKKQTGSKKSGGTKKGGKQLVPAAAGTLPIDAFAIIMTFLHPR